MKIFLMLTNKIILILASLGLIQGILLSIYLLTLKKGNRKANIFIGLVLLGLTIRIAKSVLNYYVPLTAWQRNIGISGIFIAGPFLWFYGQLLIEKNKSFPNTKYFHLIPFILFILLITLIPSDGRFELYWNYGLIVIHLAVYLILSWLLLFKNQSRISNTVFRWYRNVLIGVTLVWSFYLGNFLSLNLHYITGPIFYTFLIYAFTYLLLNRHNFNLDKYGSSTLDKKTSKDLFQKIKVLFTNEHIYLEPNVSLKTIAEKLAISSRKASQVINENENQNFYEFVNHYRIEKAKALLVSLDYKNEKMSTIAFDSGFSNITSFNVAFKKSIGMTPSAYKKSHLSV